MNEFISVPNKNTLSYLHVEGNLEYIVKAGCNGKLHFYYFWDFSVIANKNVLAHTRLCRIQTVSRWSVVTNLDSGSPQLQLTDVKFTSTNDKYIFCNQIICIPSFGDASSCPRGFAIKVGWSWGLSPLLSPPPPLGIFHLQNPLSSSLLGNFLRLPINQRISFPFGQRPQ